MRSLSISSRLRSFSCTDPARLTESYEFDVDAKWWLHNAGDTMTFANQRYFGDWVRYRGHGDVGYYLGARLIRYAMAETAFDELICWDPDRVQALWQAFLTADWFT